MEFRSTYDMPDTHLHVKRSIRPAVLVEFRGHLIPARDLRIRMCFQRRQQQYSANPSRRVCEVLDFFGFERAFEDVAFAVGKPFLEHRTS